MNALNTYFPTDWAMLHLPALADGLLHIETLGKKGQPLPVSEAPYAWGLAVVDKTLYSYLVERSFVRNGHASRVPSWVYEQPRNPYTERGGK